MFSGRKKRILKNCNTAWISSKLYCREKHHLHCIRLVKLCEQERLEMVLFFWLISSHRSKFFWNDWQKLSQFGHNVWKDRLVNTDMACIITVVGKMTKMSQRKTKPRLEARSSPIPNIILKLLVENWTLTNLFPRLMNLLCMHFTLPCTNYEAERTFGLLCHIKNYVRLSMT